MPVVTISRGAYSSGREVAERLAGALRYKCISREIVLSASMHFNIPEMTLIRAVHDAPSVFDRFSYGKQRYVAYVRQAMLETAQKDNVVYHGLAGHYFLRGIPHVIKVRILADLEDRVAEEMRREYISAEDARRALLKDDEARERWSQYIFGINASDPSLYDLVLNVRSVTVDEAVDIIASAVKLPCFQPTLESRKAMHRLYVAARLQVALMEEIPSIKVDVENGKIVVVAKGHWAQGKKLLAKIDQLIDVEKEQVRIEMKLSNR
ncbi:MAG: cytidylate kinase-like family protein [Syntrophobacteraceae bacterium]|nr:cytidylate kinase-like family protein [Syntrophobacteraceae bacterium]